MLCAGQRLHRGTEHVDRNITALTLVEAHAAARPQPSEGRRRLVEDLLAMGDEEDTASAHASGVERRQPCLAESRRQHHQPAAKSCLASGSERHERLLLHRRRCGRRRKLLLRARGGTARRRYPALLVLVDPVVAEGDRARAVEERLEARASLEEAIIAGVDDAVVPLEALLERGPSEVARADEARPLDEDAVVATSEQVCLEVEAPFVGDVNTHLRALLL